MNILGIFFNQKSFIWKAYVLHWAEVVSLTIIVSLPVRSGENFEMR